MRSFVYLLLVFSVINLLSCTANDSRTAILWSDRPEFAFYSKYFNAAQDQYKIEMFYFDYPAHELMALGASERVPDIVAGSWLKSTTARTNFKPLDSLLRNNTSLHNAFYHRLLTMGNIDGTQYLLPVSFNAPVVVFNRERGLQLSNPFTINLSEMQMHGNNFNAQANGEYTQMGFSPTWDDNFLFLIATLYGASFSEDGFSLAWNHAAIDRAMSLVHEWTGETNSGMQAVDDFAFKYLYDPPVKLAIAGRILFSGMDSSSFFTMAEDQRNNLDFRWLAEGDSIPIAEDTVYFGLTQRGRAAAAGEAFLHWFFSPETQRFILEQNFETRMNELSFGIAGGFSALRPVTEQVFPVFYPGLLGHMPPQDFLSPANILPWDWMPMKERVILPYLHDRARQREGAEIMQLERRLADWVRLNR